MSQFNFRISSTNPDLKMCMLSVAWSACCQGAFHSWLSKFLQALVMQKLEVDSTQIGSPQLQDLGQYHLPHFPQVGTDSCIKLHNQKFT